LAIVAGIDEAGFGPVLGPLVVSAASFSVPDELAEVSLWKLLAEAVGRRPSRKRRTIAIADSKKLYSPRRANSLEHLERGVLGMLAARNNHPDTLGRLLASVAPSAAAGAQQYPWHADGDLPLPRCISRTDVALAANALSVAMTRKGVSLADVRAEPVFVGEFNHMVRATNNKSVVLLSVTSRLLMHIWRNAPAGRVRIYVDRQGGRMRYLPDLQRMFEGVSLRIIEENETVSAYSMSDGRRTAEIIFATSCEDECLATALASMTSKYLRELFMAQVNAFWLRHVPGLAPTAGYYTDGRRFFGQILPVVKKLAIDERLVYRVR
jgi:hypothetical protein